MEHAAALRGGPLRPVRPWLTIQGRAIKATVDSRVRAAEGARIHKVNLSKNQDPPTLSMPWHPMGVGAMGCSGEEKTMCPSTNDVNLPSDKQKEIKVKIPVSYHVKLHTLKVLRGQEISTSVETALERFFEQLAEDPRGQKLEHFSEEAVENLI